MTGRSMMICPAAGNVPNVTKAKTLRYISSHPFFFFQSHFSQSSPFSLTSTSGNMVDVDSQIKMRPSLLRLHQPYLLDLPTPVFQR